MHPTERRARIVELVQRNHSHSVDELAEALDSSRETIRRDLVALDRDGLLRGYHGGARSLTDAANFQVAEESFSVRLTRHGEAKKKLARLAATLFEPGSSLFVDTGTTTLAFAQELAPLRQCTVITNSLGIASIFGAVRDFRHKIHVLGGEFVPDAQEMLGRTTLRQIADFRAEHVVLTVGSLQVGGILDFDEREAEVAQAMIEHAQKITVLADSSKMGQPAVFPVVPLSRIDRLVTDAPPPNDIVDALRHARVELLVATE
ncbi:DeoR/GlpR transcriptional regulator [Paracoccus versutus]|uniref:DeoR family transcriptional regulator n=1 Tax=Paracoccus versutus TaxID=34007 RepID=A0AAQ0HF62_PARVE|nr:DeoR/GlpR family DNA-binding transcription regulator [Paracoccus versutus]KGJ07887.1 hypothetical protein IT40_19880 [Paracoccus versutus]REG36487.1 DeoR family transcriptional regulator [Paracoccus versutus]WEJ79439.1 DeoR/GlpR transcriptional regulator [Paracoccus versutus]